MVKINDKYYIDATSTCYALKERIVVSDKDSKNYGQVIWRDLGYYYSINNVINGVLKMETRKFISQEEEHSLKELTDKVREFEDYIKSLKLKV